MSHSLPQQPREKHFNTEACRSPLNVNLITHTTSIIYFYRIICDYYLIKTEINFNDAITHKYSIAIYKQQALQTNNTYSCSTDTCLVMESGWSESSNEYSLNSWSQWEHGRHVIIIILIFHSGRSPRGRRAAHATSTHSEALCCHPHSSLYLRPLSAVILIHKV